MIIRCFNEEKHIGQLLDAVGRQTFADREIIVVDSGSTDNTVAIVQRYPVKLIRITPEDFSFGYSLNRGCSAATSEFLVFASAHVLPTSDEWLERLLAPFEEPRVALVYGRQTGNQASKFSEQQIFEKQYPEISNYDQATPFCNNANAAVRRSLWRMHHYDESLSGLEDLEWAQWAKSQGHRIVYNADACVIHIHEETPVKVFNRYKREAIALKRIFPDTHLTMWETAKLWVTNTLFDLARALKRGMFWRHAADILLFRVMQYFGTYSGIHYRSPMSHDLIVKFYYPRKIRMFKGDHKPDRKVPEGARIVRRAEDPR